MEKRNWEMFSEWVTDYERERLKDKSPVERIEIFESLYKTASVLRKDKASWLSDEAAKRSEHFRRLIKMRELFMFTEKRRD